jgi:hypothetical protein
MVIETLDNSKDYGDLRIQMVDELVEDELNQEIGALLAVLKTYYRSEFKEMEDGPLQICYDRMHDNHSEDAVRPRNWGAPKYVGDTTKGT